MALFAHRGIQYLHIMRSDMKYKMIIKVIAGAGLAIGHFSAVASDFGGGWARDPHTGTSYNTNAPTVDQQKYAARQKRSDG